ncbi:hypothetical protein NEMBOFW57_000845 [Staphylotrichum longicolle]|uniref:Uncharacterized protein n=1 Tax=Staphylotrichum longicolle TaxID=669026 RepID=A0AAD4F190_9PEZI|nr:hypothetical protein NEMBOFW57_000845 [Staphylotrichum longicolle]
MANGSVPAPANGISAGKSSSQPPHEIALLRPPDPPVGMKAQEKIRNANILLVTMKAMANEIAKNLVLAGIGSLTILDPEPVTRPTWAPTQALGLPAETLRRGAAVVPAEVSGNGGAGAVEVSPVAAVLGGQLAQDVINVLGGTQQPVQNFVVFDGEAMEAGVYALHPEGELGRGLLASAAPVLPVGEGDAAMLGGGVPVAGGMPAAA